MSVKMMFVAASIGMMAMSCGESGETVDAAKTEETAAAKEKEAAIVKEKTEIGDKLNELNAEIEAIDAADAEIDATIEALDQI